MELKKSLSEQERMEAALTMYKKVLAKELRGSGDVEDAMYRLQAEHGLDYWRQWLLKYRKQAGEEFIEQVRQTYLRILERSVRRDLAALENELTIEKAKGASDADLGDLVAEAETLLAKIKAKKVAKAGAV